MALTNHKNVHCFMFMTFLFVVASTISSAKAEIDEEKECGNGCQSYDDDTSKMTRCVRYACRRDVFRYFIRFGKRSEMNTEEFPREEQKLQSQLRPLQEGLRKRYIKQLLISPNRLRHVTEGNSDNEQESFGRQQSKENNRIEQLRHLLSNQLRKVNLRTILGYR